MLKKNLDWTIIGGDRIVLRISDYAEQTNFGELGKYSFKFFKSQKSPLYLLIIVFPKFDSLTAAGMALYRKMSKFI